MNEWYDAGQLRARLGWGLLGGVAASALMLLVVAWLNSLSVMPGDPLLVRPSVLKATGWSVPVLLLAELAVSFAFGVCVGVAVPPMEGSGRGVAVRTAAHLVLSSALFAGLCLLWGLPPSNWQGMTLLLGLYWFSYVVVWLLRYLTWRAELQQIRQELGLAPGKEKRKQKSLRAYLLMAAAVELAVPPVLRMVELGSDIPVLTGLFYPFLLLPFFCLATGWAVGRRLGIQLIYPPACGLLTVPGILLLYNKTALFQVLVAAVFALTGTLMGALCTWLKRNRPKKNA